MNESPRPWGYLRRFPSASLQVRLASSLMATPEGLIKNQILSYLSRLPRTLAFPHDSVGIWDPTRKIFRKRNSAHHMLGVADILGIYEGRPLAIEVKSEKGRPTQEQKNFLRLWAEQGGIAILARSIEDVRIGLHQAMISKEGEQDEKETP